MHLKVTEKLTTYVDAFDLSRYLSEKIGRSVEIGDSSNDTDYSVRIEKGDIAEYDMETINGFLSSGWISMQYGYHAIMTYCANKDWLNEGDYVIQVSW